MGQYTAHGYLYKPSYGETGRDTTSQFNAGLDLVDAYMAGEAFSAPDFGTSTLAEIVAAIGSDPATIYFPSSTVNVNANTTVPTNISCIIPNGGILHVATDVTLTINGPIEAGPYQIFSWTGTGAIDISGSPTTEIYPEWWGAIATAPSAIGTADNTAALTKMVDSTSSHQEVILSRNWYRLATAWVMDRDNGITIKGGGYQECGFYIDIGGTGTGITFGSLSKLIASCRLLDFSIIGPAGCCDYGVDFILCSTDIERVNLYMGANDYGARFMGAITSKVDIWNVSSANYPYPDADGPPSPVQLIPVPSGTYVDWQDNIFDLCVHANGGPNSNAGLIQNPISLDGSSGSVGLGSNIILRGAIENYDGSPFEVILAEYVTIRDLYVEGGGTTATISKCRGVSLDSVFLNDSSLELIIDNSFGTYLRNSQLCQTTVKSNSFGTVFGEGLKMVVATPPITINDQAGDTIFRAPIDGFIIPMQDNVNLLYNSLWNRWTATAPDSWTVDTADSVTVENSIVHLTPNSLKVIATAGVGSYSDIHQILDSYQLKRVLGKTVTLSASVYMPTAANYRAEQVYAYTTVTLAARLDNQAYAVGQGIIEGGYVWICVTAGTSAGSAPSFPAPVATRTTVTDGSVVWGYPQLNNLGSTYHSSNAGSWQERIGVTTFVPTNATALRVGFLQYVNNLNAASTAYYAEPMLSVGYGGPKAVVESREEFNSFIQIGANKISYGTAVPASGWCQRGDIVWRTDATAAQSPGWICTTAGTGGGTAVWKAFGNVGA